MTGGTTAAAAPGPRPEEQPAVSGVAPQPSAGQKPARKQPGTSAVRDIQRLILDRQLQPGDVMPTEIDLMNTLGISRSSVREALRTLKSLDIVVIEHGRGMSVGAMSLRPLVETILFRTQMGAPCATSTLDEVVDIRQSMDLGIAELIVGRCAPDQLEPLRDLVADMRRTQGVGNPFAAGTVPAAPGSDSAAPGTDPVSLDA